MQVELACATQVDKFNLSTRREIPSQAEDDRKGKFMT